MIRDFTGKDRDGMIGCIIALQNYERELEPEEKNKGEDIASAYLEELIRKTPPPGKIIVAEVDHQIVGFGSGRPESEPDEVDLMIKKWFYISDLVVLEKYRGQGIGSQLMSQLEILAKDLKLSRIVVGTLAKNQAARNFYAKQGFRDFEVSLRKKI